MLITHKQSYFKTFTWYYSTLHQALIGRLVANFRCRLVTSYGCWLVVNFGSWAGVGRGRSGVAGCRGSVGGLALVAGRGRGGVAGFGCRCGVASPGDYLPFVAGTGRVARCRCGVAWSRGRVAWSRGRVAWCRSRVA